MTHDCIPTSAKSHIVRFVDSTAVVGLIRSTNGTVCREELEQVVDWCKENNLILNADETKELTLEKGAQPCSSPCQRHTCISEWQFTPTAYLWICSGNVSLIHVITHFKKGSVIAILSQGSHVHVVTTGAGNAHVNFLTAKHSTTAFFIQKERNHTLPLFSTAFHILFLHGGQSHAGSFLLWYISN